MICPNCGFNVNSRRISQRMVDVFNLLIQGKHNNEIAKILGIKTRTVKAHIARGFDRYNVKGRVALAVAFSKDTHKDKLNELSRSATR